MIKLTRIRTAPPVHTNFFGPGREKINLELLKKKRDGELDAPGEKKWKSTFWKQSKDQLLTESNQKCAYCETPTRVVMYGDVEHFRPKSVYWWLAYSYENYLPSCGACNQEYKKDFFELKDKAKQLKGLAIGPNMQDADLVRLAPLLTVDPVDDTKGMPMKDFVKELKKEKALLVNPYYDDPAKCLAYKPILETKEVVVVPRTGTYAAVVKACEALFGINRKELLDLRFQRYTLYMTLKHTLNEPVLSAPVRNAVQNRLSDMVHEKAAYAGMIRYFETKALSSLPWDFSIVSF